jgi:hypothetical protein
MNIPKRPPFTEAELGVNPLTLTLIVPVYEKQEFQSFEGTITKEEILLEYMPKTSVFIQADYRKYVSKLPVASRELLLWIIYEMEGSKDYIWINKDRYMKECSVSLNTYKKGVKFLIQAALIGKTLFRDVYWTNPAFFFNGNRIKKYPNNLLIR